MDIETTIPSDPTPEVVALGGGLIGRVTLPAAAKSAAYRIAAAACHDPEYLLTWNCRPVAGPARRRTIEAACPAAVAGPVPPAEAGSPHPEPPMKRWFLVAGLVLLAVWLRTAVVAVDYSEFVYVTRFGEPVAKYDGSTAAGLTLKAPWPVDAAVRLDRRVQAFDLPAVESLTRDPVNRTVDKTLAVDAYVTWRIPDAEAADRFVKAVRTPEQARRILAPLLNGRLAAAVSTMPLDELIGVADTEAGLAALAGAAAAGGADGRFREADAAAVDARADRVRGRLVDDDLKKKVLGEYGIQLVDVRVRRFSYPEAVRGSIADRIRSERAKKVAEYESDGRQRAARITTDAAAAARRIEDEAAANKTRVEGEAKAEAARVRGAAFALDREFGVFLEKLQAVQAMVADTRDVLLLSTKHPLFDVLRGPPAK